MEWVEAERAFGAAALTWGMDMIQFEYEEQEKKHEEDKEERDEERGKVGSDSKACVSRRLVFCLRHRPTTHSNATHIPQTPNHMVAMRIPRKRLRQHRW